MIQYVAGAPKGKRRRKKSGETRSPTAGIENHRLVEGEPGVSRPIASSTIAAIPMSAMSSSNQNSLARSCSRRME